jgi:enolase
MTKITAVTGRTILDSRGFPTVEARVAAGNAVGVASVPSGRSVGSHEAAELRDDDRRWHGHGVSKAVSHINVQLAGLLIGKDVIDQAALDAAMRELDGTSNLKRLGANAVLAVSLACLRAAAAAADKPLYMYIAEQRGEGEPHRLPLPLVNVINGGAHAPNNLTIQEFLLVPHGFGSFGDALRAATETYESLGQILASRGVATGLGDEGGFAPDLDNHIAALEIMVDAISQAGYKPGEEISLALDLAANSFHENSGYVLAGHGLTSEQLVTEYDQLLQRFPLVSLEDALAEDDSEGWKALVARLGESVQVVGDDLTVTDPKRIAKAAAASEITGVILKPNQIGTYTDAAAARQAAFEAGLVAIASHRSGETGDDWIADLAVGWNCDQIKAGAPARGERTAKYNRLLAIEQELGSGTEFAGKDLFKRLTRRRDG